MNTNIKLFNFFFVILLILVNIIYLKHNFIGLLISLISFLIIPQIPHNFKNYIKLYLVVITSILIFLTTNNIIDSYYFNSFIRSLVMINVFFLFFIEKNLYLKFLIILLTILTPNFKYIKNQIVINSNYLNYNFWILLYTIIIGYIHYSNKNFHKLSDKCKNIIDPRLFLILSLIIPLLASLFFNKWLESRSISLCILILYEFIICKYKI